MAITSRRGAWGGVIVKRGGGGLGERGGVSAGNRTAMHRRALLAILASAVFALDSRPTVAQRSLSTPRGTGRAAESRTDQLPLARNLASDAAASASGRIPILLFFDREECPYCEQALREYLVPLSKEAWKDRALFRQVEMDRALPLIDFDGSSTTHEALAARYGASLSPTVLIVDAKGRPLAAPLVGLMTVDFYGAYLENALADAARKLVV